MQTKCWRGLPQQRLSAMLGQMLLMNGAEREPPLRRCTGWEEKRTRRGQRRGFAEQFEIQSTAPPAQRSARAGGHAGRVFTFACASAYHPAFASIFPRLQRGTVFIAPGDKRHDGSKSHPRFMLRRLRNLAALDHTPSCVARQLAARQLDARTLGEDQLLHRQPQAALEYMSETTACIARTRRPLHRGEDPAHSFEPRARSEPPTGGPPRATPLHFSGDSSRAGCTWLPAPE